MACGVVDVVVGSEVDWTMVWSKLKWWAKLDLVEHYMMPVVISRGTTMAATSEPLSSWRRQPPSLVHKGILQEGSFCGPPNCRGVVSGDPIVHCHTGGGTGHREPCSTLPHCEAWGIWDSCSTMLHYKSTRKWRSFCETAGGSGDPTVPYHTVGAVGSG